ncbi:DNA-binding transcriptional MerR regulator [Nocardioides marinisabuli]|uniref:DNA-binding transcriptional MerR regulator n=1 Tax=Nocardioides marinisabuli TaxID=419476 RepID=A0A7Y9EZY7_9ACTN|nr:MerR family transcriptional regulator [Nocardioides marinisabuli]NYD56150.1 DNA-binding transcriptional MerR regulator [Nocardioides marinisabuli]
MTVGSEVEGADALLTVDELAAAVGLTVRTTRYYASLGLLPPPLKRGRVAYYDSAHRARLELVRALQEHGFTLQAIERYVASVPATAGVEELAMQRAMLTSWTSQAPEELDRAGLDARAGRALSDEDLGLLERLALLDPVPGGTDGTGGRYRAMPNLQIGLDLLALDVPPESVGAAGDAIARHMTSLVEELTDILRSGLLAPYRRGELGPGEAERIERELPQLRRLTLEAVVAGFQRAANAVITRSLARD